MTIQHSEFVTEAAKAAPTITVGGLTHIYTHRKNKVIYQL